MVGCLSGGDGAGTPSPMPRESFEACCCNQDQSGVYMNRLKSAALVLASIGMLSAQAHASERGIVSGSGYPTPAFSQSDINELFDNAGEPMQLASLSAKEMKETEGAWIWNTIAWTAGGGALGAGTYLWSTPRSQWTWGGVGRAVGSGATAGFYNSVVPLRALGAAGSYAMGAFGAASWYR